MSELPVQTPVLLKYFPFSSGVEYGFWNELSKQKLEVLGLDDSTKELKGFYSNGDANGIPCRLNIDYTAFAKNFPVPPKGYLAHGTIKNFNTVDDFKQAEKSQLLFEEGFHLWEDISSGKAIADTSLLVRFYMLTFAELKKYHYYYWVAFPALRAPTDVQLMTGPIAVEQYFTAPQMTRLLDEFDVFYAETQQGFFLISKGEDDHIEVCPLTQFAELFAHGKKIVFGLSDPCTLPEHPGWPLRNFLTLISYHWSDLIGQEVEVLCLRDRYRGGIRSIAHSLVLHLKFSDKVYGDSAPTLSDIVGWERNSQQKLAPRFLDLSTSMDPHKLAESAVDLNLKLMRWRLLPELPLEKIASTKCLLLGAGTLGCNVARALMGWGIQYITFVDNSLVSYSNPVRQSLFTFEDSVGGGKPKAPAAAEMLKKIYPGVRAHGYCISIPMPGHPVTDPMVESVKREVEQLQDLVQGHDVVYLLMDTRESRWLPTVLAGTYGKLVINAALGFDTYLVMRHGLPPPQGDTDNATQLGCYFCNDVVAPGNSTRDRTLDQQCTVTRPGVSYIASALAVELMVSTISHPLGFYCPASLDPGRHASDEVNACPLGIVPHQIRGFLGQFNQLLPYSDAFNQCTGCSQKVLAEYKNRAFDFLLEVFNKPNYLEDLTGLTQLHVDTALAEVWELSDDEDDTTDKKE